MHDIVLLQTNLYLRVAHKTITKRGRGLLMPPTMFLKTVGIDLLCLVSKFVRSLRASPFSAKRERVWSIGLHVHVSTECNKVTT